MSQSHTLTPGALGAVERRSLMPNPIGLTAAAIALLAWYLLATIGWRQAALFLVGTGAGTVLYHAAFGFTSSWRVFIADGRGAACARRC